MSTPRVFNFMAIRHLAGGLSLGLVLVSVISLLWQGLNFGLDFSGGTLVEIGFERPVPLETVRADLARAGFGNVTAVYYGSERDVLVRLPPGVSETIADTAAESLRHDDNAVEIRRVEFVGPQVGEDLRDQGGLALLTSLFLVTVYIAIRFQLKFGIGAVVALIHDVLITLGAFSVFRWQFDLNVLAAILALIGYSLNDTIVVFDRIRENFRKLRRTKGIDNINISLSQTLERTLVTGGTTLLVLLALLFFGGEQLRGFATALTMGIVVGTYSSIYVAAYVILLLKITSEDLIVSAADDNRESDSP